MLIESLFLENFEIVSANTDGVVCLFDKNRYDEFKKIQKNWEKITKLVLEETRYDLLVMSNVNNYLAIKTGDGPIDDRVKLKGWFDFKKEPHKNHSMKIVPKALYDYYVHGIDYHKTVLECEDIYDFCKAVKQQSDCWFIERDVLSSDRKEKKLGKIVRYYVSEKGKKLIKKLPPLKESVYEGTLFDGTFTQDRSSEVESGKLVTVFNTFEKKDDYQIDYDYYINEVRKISNGIDKARS